MQTIKEYYSDKSVLNEIFNNLENPGWRTWKVQDLDGKFRQNRKRINSINKLREFLGNEPAKVYVSTAQFLNPQRVFGKTPKKAQWIVADSLFLKSDLLFDLDAENLETAHEDGKKIMEHMKNESYELLNIRFSGKKGFHILYRDNEPIREKDPLKRLEKTQKKREELIVRLPKLKTIDEHHKRIIADQFRVHAVIGTVKAETGYKVTKISEEEFMLRSTEELKRLTCQRVVKSLQDSTNHLETNDRKDTPAKTIGQEGAILTSCSYNFVDNAVKGIKSTIIEDQVDYRYVTVLKFPKEKDNLIKQIQHIYNQDDYYKFLYKDIYIYINLKLVDRRRLEKIMKYSKAMNLNSFMFYGHSWIPISETEDKEGTIIYEKPKFMDVIKSEKGINDTHSRPHANLFGLKFNNMAGKERNRICKAFVKRID